MLCFGLRSSAPLRDHYEAVGHAKAYDYIYKITEKEGLAEEDILALHRLFYHQIDAEKATQFDLLRLMREDDDSVNDTVNDTVKVGAPQLSKTEQTVLDAISSYPDYSYEKLAAQCNLSRPTIARTIKTLQNRELIRRIGSDKTGHWEVVRKKKGT